MECTPGIPSVPGQFHASVHPTSDADIILHSENSGPPKSKPIPVHKSKSIPPEELSDTDLDEELQHPDHPIEGQDKEEGEWTDTDEDVPPLASDAPQAKEYPPEPWNDTAFDLQQRLNQLRWESLEPEPDYEEYGISRGDMQRQDIQHQVESMHRCVDQRKIILQSISNSQEDVKSLLTQKADTQLKINRISRDVAEIIHSVNSVSESQDSIKNILKDLCDIINEMNNPDRSDPQDFELLKKIDDISERMTQVNLGQESVKEVMTELKSSLERKPRNNKRGYYQIIDCETPHYENKVKQPRLSSKLNFAYFDKQYGEILEVSKNREVRRCLKE